MFIFLSLNTLLSTIVWWDPKSLLQIVRRCDSAKVEYSELAMNSWRVWPRSLKGLYAVSKHGESLSRPFYFWKLKICSLDLRSRYDFILTSCGYLCATYLSYFSNVRSTIGLLSRWTNRIFVKVKTHCSVIMIIYSRYSNPFFGLWGSRTVVVVEIFVYHHAWVDDEELERIFFLGEFVY